MKKFAIATYLVLFSIWLVLVSIFGITQQVNFSHNQKVWEEMGDVGIIYDQHKIKDMKFGFGSVERNGCGAVAIYNILQLEGRPTPLPEIIKKLDFGGEILFGVGGSWPYAVKRALEDYGFKVEFSINSDKFAEMANSSKYNMYGYSGVNKEKTKITDRIYGHFQLFYKDGEKEKFINTSNYSSFEQIQEAKKDAWIKYLITVN